MLLLWSITFAVPTAAPVPQLSILGLHCSCMLNMDIFDKTTITLYSFLESCNSCWVATYSKTALATKMCKEDSNTEATTSKSSKRGRIELWQWQSTMYMFVYNTKTQIALSDTSSIQYTCTCVYIQCSCILWHLALTPVNLMANEFWQSQAPPIGVSPDPLFKWSCAILGKTPSNAVAHRAIRASPQGKQSLLMGGCSPPTMGNLVQYVYTVWHVCDNYQWPSTYKCTCTYTYLTQYTLIPVGFLPTRSMS